MDEPKPATPASKYFSATVAIITGAFFFAIGAGLLPIPGGPSNLHGPLWLVLCVGLAFVLAGVAIFIQLLGHANDSGDLPAGTPQWLRAVQYLIGLSIFVCFGAISSWIAFGPGERHFSGTFIRLSQAVRSEHAGRQLIFLHPHRLNRPMISALASVLKCRLKPTTAAEVSDFTSILSAFTANTVNR
jgi:hypothetical protein